MSPCLLRASGLRPMDWLVAPKLMRRSQVPRLAPRRSRDDSWYDPLLQFWIRQPNRRSLSTPRLHDPAWISTSELFSSRELDPHRKLSGEDATLQSVRGRRGRRERDERQDHQQTVRTELDPADYRLCRRLQRADRFLEAAKLAAERGKPIVLIKIDSNASGCSSLESGVNRLAVQDDVRLR